MTARRDLKDRIRARMLVTGETYTAARAAIVMERARAVGTQSTTPANTDAHDIETALAPIADASPRLPGRLYVTDAVDAIILKVNYQSVRIRIVGESNAITLRGPGVHSAMPGQIAQIAVTKRWMYRDHEYASSAMGDKRIDVRALGLVPLPLEDMGIYDLRSTSEPVRSPDPCAPMWRKLTKPARRAFRFDPIAWDGGVQDRSDMDQDLPVCDASELIDLGDYDGATELLMNVLAKDLRCIDAHAHLGNIEFRRHPERALVHYEIGMRIGDLSLGPFFKEMIPWGVIYNRPFLRCLHGYGLALWRLGRHADALLVFERILELNPTDNQGIRFLLDDVRTRRTWEEFDRGEDDQRDRRRLAPETTVH